MTPLRQAFHAACVGLGLCITSPTFAEPLAPIGPPTAPAAVIAPPSAPSAPKAAAAPSNWLASRPAPKLKAATAPSGPSSGRLLGMAVLVLALGGAALYLKRRNRAEQGKGKLPRAGLTVLSSTRIGPKAHAVVIVVAGRQMLLGVTDASVKRLAFIDEIAPEEEESERRMAREPARPARAAQVTHAATTPARAGSFADVLKTAFGKRGAAPVDAASVLAAETHDTVGGKPVVVSSARMLDVEGQAQGLIRRLSGPRA